VDWPFLLLLTGTELLSFFCIWRLWRSPAPQPVPRRVLLTLVLLVPLLGVILYGFLTLDPGAAPHANEPEAEEDRAGDSHHHGG
jgi:hypothetical protein